MSSLGDPAERERRLARRFEPHVAELNRLVERIRTESGQDVPFFDPDSGGIGAAGLVLGQDPSGTALQTGFISPDNPDPTAAKTTELTGDLPRARIVFWNAVPWRYTPAQLRAGTRDAGAKWLVEALHHLPALRAVVIMGRDSRQVWERLPPAAIGTGVTILFSPHLSQRGLNPRRGEGPDERRDRARSRFDEFRRLVAASS